MTSTGGVVVQRQGHDIEVRDSVSSDGVVHSLGFRPDVVGLSDDGRRLLLREVRDSRDNNLMDAWHLLDAKTGKPLRMPWLAPSGGEYIMAAWSNGRPIVLYDSLGVRSEIEVFDIEADRKVFGVPGLDTLDALLSADGRWLAMKRFPLDVEERAGVYVYSLEDTDSPYAHIDGDYALDRFSFDGKYLILEDYTTNQLKRYDLTQKRIDLSFSDQEHAQLAVVGSLSSDGTRRANVICNP